MCSFDGIQRGSYFRGKLIRRTEVDVQVEKLKNEEVAGKDGVTGEMVKGGYDIVVDKIWSL